MTNDGRLGSESPPAVYRSSFDPDTESASDAVVAALSSVTNGDDEQRDSIDAVVDPIVFDALLRRARSPIDVSFDYVDHEVTVSSTGEITIRTVGENTVSDHVYRFEDEPPSQAVVQAVAESKGVDPVELDPLYDIVDPGALDALVEYTDGVGEPTCSVSFRMAGLRVRVTADRRVYVRPAIGEPADADAGS